MKKLISIVPMILTIIILLLTVENKISPTCVAISVLSSVFTFFWDKNTKNNCSYNAKHLAPQRTFSPYQILNTGLMISFIFSNPYSLGIATDTKYSIFWGISSAILLLYSLSNWCNVHEWGNKNNFLSDKYKKTTSNLKSYYVSMAFIQIIFIVASAFAKLEWLPSLIILNQTYVTYFKNK